MASVSLLGSARAGVADDVYAIGFATNNIYRVNLAGGTATQIYSGYPIAPASSNSAAFALRGSDGMLFYIAGTSGDDAVYRWNPATPAVAPVFLGTTGASVPYMPRLVFAPDETLYALDNAGTQLYSVDTVTGAATPSGSSLSGTPAGGGDMAFDPADGTLYLVAGTILYTVPLGGGTLSSLGSIAGLSGTAVGIAFDPVGSTLLVANNANPAKLYSVNVSGSPVATPFSGTMTTGMGDLASTPSREADLQMTKTDGATAEDPGTSVTYTVTATNAGPSNAPGATVTDALPASILTPTWTCVAAGGAACPAASGSGSISETVATFPAGSTLTYTITGTISPSASGTLVNTASASVASGFTDPDPASNSATDTDTLVTPIVAADDSGSVPDGVTGGTAVANVLSNDTLGGAPATVGNVTLSQLASSNPGVSLDTATGAVNVAPGTPAGSYTLDYRICEQASPSNCDSATVTVTVPVTPIVAADDSGSVADGVVGGTAVANVLSNDTLAGGPATVGNVTLSQLSSSNSGVSLNTATGAVTVAPGTPAGSYTLTYQICEQASPSNCDSATVTVTVGAAPPPPASPPPPSTPPPVSPPPAPPPPAPPAANLSITKSGPAQADIGDTVSYTLSVHNNGPDTAANVVATDTLPNELALVAASVKLNGSTAGSCAAAGQVIRCTFASLPSGATVTVSLRATLQSGRDSVVNQASVVSSTPDPDGRDNSASRRLDVRGRGATRHPAVVVPKGKAALAITKTALVKHPVRAGQVFRYRITIKNTGKVAAVAVRVCDVPSRRLVFVSAPGATFSNGHACWLIKLLAPGESRTPHVTTRLDRGAKRGKVRNEAVAKGHNTGNKAVRDTSKVQVLAVKAGRPGGVTG